MYYLKKALVSDPVSLMSFGFGQPDSIKAQLNIIRAALNEACEEVAKLHFAKASSSTATFFSPELTFKIAQQHFIMATGCSISIDSFTSIVNKLTKQFTYKLDNIDRAHERLKERVAEQKQDDNAMDIDKKQKKRKREDTVTTDDLDPPPNKKPRS